MYMYRICLVVPSHSAILRVVGHGYCVAVKECADLGFMVN